MKIRTKISLTSIFIVLISMALVVPISIFNIKKTGEANKREYRDEEQKKTKQSLKNLIDIAYESIKANYNNARDKNFLEKYYGYRLKDAVNRAISKIKEEAILFKVGKLSLAEAQKRAKEAARIIIYDGKGGYVWISSADEIPAMIMHPTMPSLEGHALDNQKYETAKGPEKNIFRASSKVCRKNGEGFVEYTWPKLTKNGFKPNMPKLSYVKMFKEWNWIIGSGIYIDDAINDAKALSIEAIQNMRYNNGVGYFWINNMELPFPRMIMHPIFPKLDGKPLDAPKYNCVGPAKENLFAAAVRICEKNGAGFLEYPWPKPTENGTTIEQKKMSYVKCFKEWDWVIGAGVYIDRIEKNIAAKDAKINKDIRNLIVNILLVALAALFVAICASVALADSLSKPLTRLLMAMTTIKKDGLRKISVNLGKTEEFNALENIFEKMLDSIHDSTRKLAETMATKDKFENELKVAHDIQYGIVPKIFPPFPTRKDLNIFAILKPASHIGGDFYDFFFIAKDMLCFAIGDVSGKGVPASLFMAVTVNLLRATAKNDIPPSEIANIVNRDLAAENPQYVFVTFFLGILNLKTGEMNYCNAGHCPPYIKRKEKLISLEDVHGMPLGLDPETEYESGKTTLEKNDKIILYTDGISEAYNSQKKMFGTSRLESLIEKDDSLSCQEIAELILENVESHIGASEQSDDITVLVLSYFSKKQGIGGDNCIL